MGSLFGSAASHASVSLRLLGIGCPADDPSPPFAPAAAAAAIAAGAGTGCTRIDLICGGRVGTWYATLTSSMTGVVLPALLVKVSRYCRNRAGGDWTCRNSVTGASSVHFDQPFSAASCTLPLRVATVIDVPSATDPCRCTLPNRLICVASSTGLMYVPLVA